MVVTQSLARGVVREVIRNQHERRSELMTRLQRVRCRPPSTMRGFAQWFRERIALHEKEALLIAHGMVGRRTGAFAPYSLRFLESAGDWSAQIAFVHVEFRPGSIERVASETLPVVISGHALERLFQRTDSIDWNVIRDCLAGATLFANAVVPAWLTSGCKQCAVPAEKGMLVGQIAGGVISLRTFLPETQLGLRWEALYHDLKRFSVEHGKAINEAALGSNEDASLAFGAFLSTESRRWLRQPYAPGRDRQEDAWRAHETQLQEEMALAA